MLASWFYPRPPKLSLVTRRPPKGLQPPSLISYPFIYYQCIAMSLLSIDTKKKYQPPSYDVNVSTPAKTGQDSECIMETCNFQMVFAH